MQQKKFQNILRKIESGHALQLGAYFAFFGSTLSSRVARHRETKHPRNSTFTP